MPEKPIGSGYFATVWGGLFVLVALATLSKGFVTWASGLTPTAIMRIWCLCVGAILITWGINRIKKGDKTDKKIGQDTITFVMTILAATFALGALFHDG
jgi:hypothetical protein